MQKYNKAVAAVIGGIIGLLVSWGLLPAEWQDPATVTAITGVVSTILVWAVPNRGGP